MIWLLRFAAVVAAFVLLRNAVRWCWHALSGSSRPEIPSTRQGVVKRDPACGTWVDVELSVQARAGAEVLHFCSTRCRDAYLAQQHLVAQKAP